MEASGKVCLRSRSTHRLNLPRHTEEPPQTQNASCCITEMLRRGRFAGARAWLPAATGAHGLRKTVRAWEDPEGGSVEALGPLYPQP